MKMVILHIEDQRLYWQLLAGVCANDSRHILIATSIEEAITIERKTPKIDLIITDYRLGSDTCQKFFDYLNYIKKEIPAIIFSGEDTNEISKKIFYNHIMEIVEKSEFNFLAEYIQVFQDKHLNT